MTWTGFSAPTGASGGTQRTDSTHALGRIRDLNRLELAGETVRAALEALAAAAPGWLARVIGASWQEVYGQRIDGWRLPASEAKRKDLAGQYGADGYHLLQAARAPGAPGWLRDLPAVQVLRQVWVQQYTRGGDGTAKRREAGLESGLPPGRSRITSRTTWTRGIRRNAARAGGDTKSTSPRPAPARPRTRPRAMRPMSAGCRPRGQQRRT
jgi:hypothetical protein